MSSIGKNLSLFDIFLSLQPKHLVKGIVLLKNQRLSRYEKNISKETRGKNLKNETNKKMENKGTSNIGINEKSIKNIIILNETNCKKGLLRRLKKNSMNRVHCLLSQ